MGRGVGEWAELRRVAQNCAAYRVQLGRDLAIVLRQLRAPRPARVDWLMRDDELRDWAHVALRAAHDLDVGVAVVRPVVAGLWKFAAGIVV